MALENTDLLAVYRETEQKNYRVTVSQILAKTPAPVAPALNAVLGSGNTSKNIDIIVQDANLNSQVTLSGSNPSAFILGLTSEGNITVGETTKIVLKPNGNIIGNHIDLIGNIEEGLALAVYGVGTTVDTVATATKTVAITNAGAAIFSGPLEAESIDGGVYAEASAEIISYSYQWSFGSPSISGEYFTRSYTGQIRDTFDYIDQNGTDIRTDPNFPAANTSATMWYSTDDGATWVEVSGTFYHHYYEFSTTASIPDFSNPQLTFTDPT